MLTGSLQSNLCITRCTPLMGELKNWSFVSYLKFILSFLEPRQPELMHFHCQLEQVVKTFALGFGFSDSITPDVSVGH